MKLFILSCLLFASALAQTEEEWICYTEGVHDECSSDCSGASCLVDLSLTGFSPCEDLTVNPMCEACVACIEGVDALEASEEMGSELPACVADYTTWSSNWGECETYAEGGMNANFCGSDQGADGNIAKEVCPQCGECDATITVEESAEEMMESSDEEACMEECPADYSNSARRQLAHDSDPNLCFSFTYSAYCYLCPVIPESAFETVASFGGSESETLIYCGDVDHTEEPSDLPTFMPTTTPAEPEPESSEEEAVIEMLEGDVCGAVLTGSTTGNADGVSNTDSSAGEYIYGFTAQPGFTYTFSTCNPGTNYDTYLTLLDASYGTVSINDDMGNLNCPSNGEHSSLTYTFESSETYYIVVEGWGTEEGNFELDITCETSEPTMMPTIEDSSADHVIEFIDDVCTMADIIDTTVGDPHGYSPSEGYTAGEHVYAFIAPEENVVFSTCNPGTDYDTYLSVLTWNGDVVYQIDDAGSSCATNVHTIADLTDLTPGMEYHLVVEGWSGSEGQFHLSGSCYTDEGSSEEMIESSDEEESSGELTLCVGDYNSYDAGFGLCGTYAEGGINRNYCSGDLDENGLTPEQVCPQCGSCVVLEDAAYVDPQETCGYEAVESTIPGAVTFVFTAPVTERLTFSTCSDDTNYDTFLTLTTMEGSFLTDNDDDFSCVDSDSGTVASSLSYDMEQGDSVRLVVSGYGSSVGTFHLTVSCGDVIEESSYESSEEEEEDSEDSFEGLYVHYDEYVADMEELQQQLDDLTEEVEELSGTVSSVAAIFSASAKALNCPAEETTEAPMTEEPTMDPTMMTTDEPTMDPTAFMHEPSKSPSVFSDPAFAVDHYNTKCGGFNSADRTFKTINMSVEECFLLCLDDQDCLYFSHNTDHCMGCSVLPYSETDPEQNWTTYRMTDRVGRRSLNDIMQKIQALEEENARLRRNLDTKHN